mmetsp:Transcript_32736/g.96500  ORF Transcript_32736/g.96500 Transcript_32736/m.96500 type:complete len:236 (-) Transcript_32736:1393-2100(-)
MGSSSKSADKRFVVHLDSGTEPKAWNTRTYLDLLLKTAVVGLALCWVASYWIEDEEHLRLLEDVQGVGTIVVALLMSIPWRSGSGGDTGGGRKSKPKSPGLFAMVEVLPLGVQISTTTTTKGGRASGGTASVVVVGTPRFLPREDIYDVIVNEIVMGRSVESKVLFRLRLDGRSKATEYDENGHGESPSATTTTIFQLLRDGSIELVDAFPPVKLTHAQCLSLCEGISEAIEVSY